MSKKRITQVEYEITLSDGKNYAIKPLSLAELKDSEELFKFINSLDDNTDIESVPGLMGKLIDVCFVILGKSNSKMTKDEVGHAVGMADIKNILGIGLSGELPKDCEIEAI